MRARFCASPTSRRANSASSSAARRDRVKPIVRMSSWTSFDISHDASVSALRRAPVSSSMIGGFQSANSFSPDGAASATTSSNGSPVRRVASSPGLPIVALASIQRGLPP